MPYSWEGELRGYAHWMLNDLPEPGSMADHEPLHAQMGSWYVSVTVLRGVLGRRVWKEQHFGMHRLY